MIAAAPVIPWQFAELLEDRWQYVVRYGGRGGMKTWSFAAAAVALAYTRRERVLCTREFQNSIEDSVHAVIADMIERYALAPWFSITRDHIESKTTRSTFSFKGLKHKAETLKSTEGVTLCWVEEARTVSQENWDYLLPTIRKEGSRTWINFNTENESDPVYQQFVLNPPPLTHTRKVTYTENKNLPAALLRQAEHCRATDPDKYDWVWLGNVKKVSDLVIFKGKYRIDRFTRPFGVQPLLGVDWGFSNDPFAGVEFYIHEDRLFIEYEVGGVGIEIDDLPAMLLKLPSAAKWPLKADSSRPETISYVARRALNIAAAAKWPGCVEDGVAFLKGAFREIVIHERCVNVAAEFASYSYKADKTGLPLPVIADKDNHYIDAIRYGLDGYITGDDLADWEKAYA